LDAAYFSYCEQELTPMTERRNPKLFQVLVCQMGQDSEGNVVLGKALSVLPEAELFEPVRNPLHRNSADFPLGFNTGRRISSHPARQRLYPV
jgi:hypothetical protein